MTSEELRRINAMSVDQVLHLLDPTVRLEGKVAKPLAFVLGQARVYYQKSDPIACHALAIAEIVIDSHADGFGINDEEEVGDMVEAMESLAALLLLSRKDERWRSGLLDRLRRIQGPERNVTDEAAE